MFKGKATLFLFSAMFLVAMFGNCSKSGLITGNNATGSGVALLKIKVTTGSIFQSLAHIATLTVSASDMLTITQNLTITDTSVEGTVAGIPAGKNRLFSLSVYDSLDTLQYQGSATVNVIADSTVKVSINVDRISGSAIVNGNINEGDSIPKLGLVAYYPFSGNTNDISGNGLNATNNGATLSADRFGAANAAYYFNGNSSLTLGYFSAFKLPKFTLSVWVKMDSVQSTGVYTAIVCSPFTWSGPNGGGAAWKLWFEGGKWKSRMYDTVDVGWKDIASNVALSTKWIHLSSTFNGSIQKFYVNGVFVDSLLSYVSYSWVDQVRDSVYAGASRESPTGALSDFIKGAIDDIRIYSRALSDSEILALYHEGGWTGN
ncbi:MAG: LamG domain-containing protein [Chitinivibrionales bacterium]